MRIVLATEPLELAKRLVKHHPAPQVVSRMAYVMNDPFGEGENVEKRIPALPIRIR